MKKLLLLLLLVVCIAAAIVWGVLRKSDPPKVNFARVKRQLLISTLPTNGKVEPSVWQAVRAETGGVVSRAPVEDGKLVAIGDVMAVITDLALQGELWQQVQERLEQTAVGRLVDGGGHDHRVRHIEGLDGGGDRRVVGDAVQQGLGGQVAQHDGHDHVPGVLEPIGHAGQHRVGLGRERRTAGDGGYHSHDGPFGQERVDGAD